MAQKGFPSPGHPPFASTPHPIPVQPGHLSTSLEIGNPALFPEDRGPWERGNPGWRAEEQTWKTDTHTKSNMHTQLYKHTGSPSARDLGDQVWDQGQLPLCPDPFLFGNRRGRDAPCPLASRQQASTEAKEPDPGHFRASDQSGTTLLPGRLHSLAPAGECPAPDLTSPHTGLLSGWAFSQYQ